MPENEYGALTDGVAAMEAVRAAAAQLKEKNIDNAALEARWMVAQAMRLPASELLFSNRRLTAAEAGRIDGYVRQRLGGQPLQYIFGTQEFMGLTFYVDSRVLIPRQDTETLAERAISHIRGRALEVLDLCTGSGCVGIAIKKFCPACRVAATDSSRDALAVCRRNAAALDADIEIVQGDLFAAVPSRRFDLIVSNPPYIKTPVLRTLQPEVQREPALALDGGNDGLSFYRRIALDAPEHMKAGGKLMLEVGHDQAEPVGAMLRDAFSDVEYVQDAAGIQRVVVAG